MKFVIQVGNLPLPPLIAIELIDLGTPGIPGSSVPDFSSRCTYAQFIF